MPLSTYTGSYSAKSASPRDCSGFTTMMVRFSASFRSAVSSAQLPWFAPPPSSRLCCVPTSVATGATMISTASLWATEESSVSAPSPTNPDSVAMVMTRLAAASCRTSWNMMCTRDRSMDSSRPSRAAMMGRAMSSTKRARRSEARSSAPSSSSPTPPNPSLLLLLLLPGPTPLPPLPTEVVVLAPMLAPVQSRDVSATSTSILRCPHSKAARRAEPLLSAASYKSSGTSRASRSRPWCDRIRISRSSSSSSAAAATAAATAAGATWLPAFPTLPVSTPLASSNSSDSSDGS
mmetsp:Transcript_59889/g.112914  ORF Transcript_59889/g.112914 Transcript_59889/m.112914 type:complete len:292 (-) Transcript_59889:12-887(-)